MSAPPFGLPDRPRIRHGWRCTRHGATVEVVKQDATGRARVVDMCQECGGTDLLDQVRHTPQEQ